MNGYEHACEYTMSILKHSRVYDRAVPVADICRRYRVEIREERIWPRRAMLDRARRTIILHPLDYVVQSWYIAHEMAHVVLPPEYGEVSCDTFAYCLLMPHEWILRDLNQAAPQLVAEWYGVTPAVVKRRVRMLRASMTQSQNQSITSTIF